MKKILVCAFLAVSVVGLTSCEETPSQPARVWGYVAPSILPNSFVAKGTLGDESEAYYGFCRYKDDVFSFGLGSGAPTSDASPTNFYMNVTGISGPAVEGVFGEGGEPKRSESLWERFDSAAFFIGPFQSWNVGRDDLPDLAYCHVNLLAKALPTELLPEEYGSDTFDYYVGIECTTLDIAEGSGQGSPLKSFYVKLYFAGCED